MTRDMVPYGDDERRSEPHRARVDAPDEWRLAPPAGSAPVALGPDGPPIYTYIRFRVRLPGANGVGHRDYDYAGLRAGDGKWYLTGGETRQGVDWATLLDSVRPVLQGPIVIMTDRASVFP